MVPLSARAWQAPFKEGYQPPEGELPSPSVSPTLWNWEKPDTRRLDCSWASENAEAPAGPICGLLWAPSMEVTRLWVPVAYEVLHSHQPAWGHSYATHLSWVRPNLPELVLFHSVGP